ncbi:MAG: hypothetical protein V3T69_12925, partial [Acidiferrobacterales bacterium]
MKQAGLKPYISKRRIDADNALLKYQSLGTELHAIVEHIRDTLSSAMETNEVVLGEQVSKQPNYVEILKNHPTAGVIELADKVDAIISDDRYLNKHIKFRHDDLEIPTVTSIDLLSLLLDRAQITFEQWLELRTNL